MAKFVRIEETLPGIWNFFDPDLPKPYHVSKFFFDMDMDLFQVKEGRGGSGAKRPQYPRENISVKVYGQALVPSFPNSDALKAYLKANNFPGYFDEISGVPEAPKDGKTYARKDGAWIEVTGGSTAIATTQNFTVTGDGNPKTFTLTGGKIAIQIHSANGYVPKSAWSQAGTIVTANWDFFDGDDVDILVQ